MKSQFKYLFLLPLLVLGTILSVAMDREKVLWSESALFQDNVGISGPYELCLYYGSSIGEYFGGGLPTDVFHWKVFDENEGLLFDREGAFQRFSYTFSVPGIYTIELTARRGVFPLGTFSKTVVVKLGAPLVLERNYLICTGGSLDLTLVDPSFEGLDQLLIEWSNENGDIIGSGNTVQVTEEGIYTASLVGVNADGSASCPFQVRTIVSVPVEYELSTDLSETCEGWRPFTLSAGSTIPGIWFFEKNGSGERKVLGTGGVLDTNVENLDGPGDYMLIFVVNDPEDKYCKKEDSLVFTILPRPEVAIEIVSEPQTCSDQDAEVLVIIRTDLTQLQLFREDNQILFLNNPALLQAGDSLRLPPLGTGTYSVLAVGPACSQWNPFTIAPQEETSEPEFTVEAFPEICTSTGKQDGGIIVRFTAPFTGTHKLLSVNGRGLAFGSGSVVAADSIVIRAPAGQYFVELEDENGCVTAHPNLVRVFVKEQANFTVPNLLTVCRDFGFVPDTRQDLVFTLLYPDKLKTVTLKAGEPFALDQQGEYTLLGVHADESLGICPRQISFNVRLVDPIPFEPVLVAEDCFGSKTYEARITGVNLANTRIQWFNERDELVGTGRFLFPTSFGTFKLVVTPLNVDACTVIPKTFEVRRPDFQLDATLTASLYCEPSRFSVISLETDFGEVDHVKWIYYDAGNNPIPLPEFFGQREIRITQLGAYEAVMFSSFGCEIGRKLVQVDAHTDYADFDLEEEVLICDHYLLTPATLQPLAFTITLPDGSEEILAPGEAFLLEKAGVYVFEGYSADPELPLCTVRKSVTVSIAPPVDFQPELEYEDCDGNIRYRANVFGEDPNELDFYWYDPDGIEVGRGQFFEPLAFGAHSLEVRPKGSLACPNGVKSFDVKPVVDQLEVSLEVKPFCENDVTAELWLDLPSTDGLKIRWSIIDANGSKIALRQFDDKRLIEVDQEGVYLVEVFNRLDCLLGSDDAVLVRVLGEAKPELEDTYVFCSFLNYSESIDAGDFAAYEWYLGSQLVSDQRAFLPNQAGNYTLVVTGAGGCRYETSFSVVEDCKLEIKIPNALRYDSREDQRFLVYPNYLVDEVSVWIYNSWGKLLFFCESQVTERDMPVCKWDGLIQGQKLMPGTYAVKLVYLNRQDGKAYTDFKTLLVVD